VIAALTITTMTMAITTETLEPSFGKGAIG
jgi:hypothetical protein